VVDLEEEERAGAWTGSSAGRGRAGRAWTPAPRGPVRLRFRNDLIDRWSDRIWVGSLWQKDLAPRAWARSAAFALGRAPGCGGPGGPLSDRALGRAALALAARLGACVVRARPWGRAPWRPPWGVRVRGPWLGRVRCAPCRSRSCFGVGRALGVAPVAARLGPGLLCAGLGAGARAALGRAALGAGLLCAGLGAGARAALGRAALGAGLLCSCVALVAVRWAAFRVCPFPAARSLLLGRCLFRFSLVWSRAVFFGSVRLVVSLSLSLSSFSRFANA